METKTQYEISKLNNKVPWNKEYVELEELERKLISLAHQKVGDEIKRVDIDHRLILAKKPKDVKEK